MLVAPNWDLSSLLEVVDWEDEGGMGEPVLVFGIGGGGVDETLFSKEVAEVAKLHKVEDAADEDDDEDGEEVLGGIDLSLSVVNGSTGL